MPNIIINILFFIIISISSVSAMVVPPLNSPIEDYGSVLDLNQKGSLELKIVELSNNEKAELAILTVPSLEDETSIVEYTKKVYQTWQLDKEYGVLIVLAMKEGKANIQLGTKLQKNINYYKKQKFTQDMNNFLKKGHFFEALNSYIVNLDKMMPSLAEKEANFLKARKAFYIFIFGMFCLLLFFSIQAIRNNNK